MQAIYEKGGAYLDNNPTWHAEESPWKAQQILEILHPFDVALNSIAEVGCGAGEILRELRHGFPGATIKGFDISPNAIAIAKSRAPKGEEIEFRAQDIRAVQERFDLVLAIDVVEHIEDCFSFLRDLKKTGTRKLLHVPLDMSVENLLRNGVDSSRKKLGHLHYFCSESVLGLMEETGYRVIRWKYTKAYQGNPTRRSLRHRLMTLARNGWFSMHPDSAALILGGFSMLVLAE